VPPADLVLVVQHRPAEFPRRDAESLIASQPLARIIVGLGPWCEPHHRSERLWPEAAAVSLRGVASRISHEVRILAGMAGRVPVTASRDEILLSEHNTSAGLDAAEVGLHSPDPAFRSMLDGLLRSVGAEPVESGQAAVLLYDADPPTDDGLHRIGAVRAGQPARRIVAFTALPTKACAARLRRAGADIVLSKPFDVSELLAAVGRRIGNPSRSCADGA
jgi:CheY-like chemotaxis protein